MGTTFVTDSNNYNSNNLTKTLSVPSLAVTLFTRNKGQKCRYDL